MAAINAGVLWAPYATTASTSTVVSSAVYDCNISSVGWERPKPESALDWLDRRVEEMRVKL